MIKVIACDMDGTLLNDEHQVAPETAEAVRRACESGIRFIITTGRNFSQAMEQLAGWDLTCDYILASGAEVRDSKQRLVNRIGMDLNLCEEIFEELKKWPVSVIFATDSYDYRIGTEEQVEESLILQGQIFHLNMPREEVVKTSLYQRMKARPRAISSMEEVKRARLTVYKIFLFSDDVAMLGRLNEVLSKDRRIAVAASFETNLEITDVRAQKGPVLKAYIESLGYSMEEVMALGDSMNDYSMLSMDFGATIAMGNAMPEVKEAAKYVTKTNEEAGVAYVIHQLLQ
ncbi:MAG: HAD family phosphatase [Lachnospiraceae bacterium]|nr:HAD family phosphatase [Lachnospiraceae bacterium]